MIKIKKRDILAYVRAVENPLEGVQFDADVARTLIKNKNTLKIEYEALQLQNRPVPGFLDYQYAVQKLQAKTNADQLPEQLKQLALKYEKCVDEEIKRRDDFEAQLDNEVEIDLVPINANKITGEGISLLKFLSTIQPFWNLINLKQKLKRQNNMDLIILNIMSTKTIFQIAIGEIPETIQGYMLTVQKWAEKNGYEYKVITEQPEKLKGLFSPYCK